MRGKMKKGLQKIGELTTTFMTFFKSSEMSLSSIAVACYLLLAIFPLGLIIGNILPFLHIDTSGLLSFLSEQLPSDVYRGIEPVINNLLNQRNTGLLSLSVLAGFWTFSRALSALQMSMNKAYEVADRLMEWVSSLLHRITGEPSPVWDRIVYGILVFVIAIVVARILRMIVIYVIHRIIKYKGGDLLKGLVEAKVFTHITHVIPPLVILSLLPFAFHGTPELLRIIEKVCWIYLLGVLVFSINTQISVFWRIYSRRTAFRDRPMKGMIQIIKGLLIGIWVIIAVSILIERSPMALITGLGAFAAVLMLIFKDSILGFVAGVQLSQNDMIRNGDWIVVPGGAVNGVVIDVSLNTVKVQNFDNTIVTIPPYSLISGEVQNWRGMSDSGGRRIMRSFTIDLNTVKFCTPELLQNLKQIDILRGDFYGMNKFGTEKSCSTTKRNCRKYRK